MIRLNQGEPKLHTEKHRVNPAVGFGTSFAAGMALFAIAGHALDLKTGREPLYTLLGIFLGLVYGGWELWKLVTEVNRRAEEDRMQQDNEEGQKHD